MEHWIPLAYFIFIFVLAFKQKIPGLSGQAFLNDYVLAGRQVSLFAFVATLVTTAYGWVLGIGELYYEYGIAAWLFLSLPYSASALVFAFVIAPKMGKTSFLTLSAMLASVYDKKTALIGTFWFLFMSIPAAYLLMTAQVANYLWEIGIPAGILAAALFSFLYLYHGGFKAVLRTDVLQFFFMFAGFALLSFFLWYEHQGEVWQALPTAKTSLSADLEFSWTYLIAWYLIALITFVDPAYYHRLFALSDGKRAKKGILWAVLAWTCFDVFAAWTAIHAIGLLEPSTDSAVIYFELSSMVMPTWAQGIFTAGLLACIMSTSDSFIFYSAVSLKQDILSYFLPKKQNDKRVLTLCIAFIAVVSASLAWAYRNDTVVTLFLDLAPIGTASMLLPMMTIYFPKFQISAGATFVHCVFIGAFTMLYQFLPFWEDFRNAMEVSNIFVGLLVSLLFYVAVHLKRGQQKSPY